MSGLSMEPTISHVQQPIYNQFFRNSFDSKCISVAYGPVHEIFQLPLCLYGSIRDVIGRFLMHDDEQLKISKKCFITLLNHITPGVILPLVDDKASL